MSTQYNPWKKKLIYGSLISAALCSTNLFASIASPSPSKETIASIKKIVGYYPEWGIYSGHQNYNPADMAIAKMTHINYAFTTIKNGEIAIFDDWAATGIASQFNEAFDSEYKGVLGQFKKLEAQFPETSFMISIGGWSQSANFRSVAQTEEARARFAASVVEFVRRWHFDGVDIDWEFPGLVRQPDTVDNPNDQGTPGADDSEGELFTLLLKSLREALDQAGSEDGTYYQLSAAVSANKGLIDKTNPQEYSQYLDFVNLLTYDLHGAWENTTNHQTALYSRSDAGVPTLSIDDAVRYFISKGVPSSKVVIGAAFYSRGWQGVRQVTAVDDLPGLFASASGGANGLWDGGRAGGVNPYWQIKKMEQDPEFIKYYDEVAQAPYLYSPGKGEMYTYDDPRSVGQKVAYVGDQNLGGIIFWEVTGDAPLKGTELLDVIYNGFYLGEVPEITLPPEPQEQPPNNDPVSDQSGSGTAGIGSQSGSGVVNSSVGSWASDAVYTGGEVVTFNGVSYEAQWWTRGDEPGSGGPWGVWRITDKAPDSNGGNSSQEGVGQSDSQNSVQQDNSPAASEPDDNQEASPPAESPTSQPASPNGSWQATSVYTAGQTASYNGRLYRAKWWTQSNIPGTEQWGPWEDIGEAGPEESVSAEDGATAADASDVDTGSAIPTENGIPVLSIAQLSRDEERLTSSDLMQQVRHSIRTIDNALVDEIEPLRDSNPANVRRVEAIVSESDWDYLFPRRTVEYSYSNFLKAVGKFPAFCGDYNDGRNSDAICRKALSTMFAHFAQETGGHTSHWEVPEWRQALVHVRELGWSEGAKGGYNGECNPNIWQGQAWPCGTFADGDFKSYFGRGAKQLSYNYNYGPFSEAVTGSVRTLLDNPELVADTWFNLASAVFFFVYPQPPKPSMLHIVDGTWQPNEHDRSAGLLPGFGVTTQVINGGIECGGADEHIQSANRIGYYREFAKYLGVDIPVDEVLGCKGMKQFATEGAGALAIYWEQDWGYNPANPDGQALACQLVGYQTAFSAFKEGDYRRCVENHFDIKLSE